MLFSLIDSAALEHLIGERVVRKLVRACDYFACSRASIAVGLFAIGCGWSPPGPSPTSTGACGPTDAPSPDTVAQAIGTLPEGAQWRETSRGHTPDCRLNWVVVTAGDASDSPMQVLFFDRNNSLGAGHTRAAFVHQRHLDGQ